MSDGEAENPDVWDAAENPDVDDEEAENPEGETVARGRQRSSVRRDPVTGRRLRRDITPNEAATFKRRAGRQARQDDFYIAWDDHAEPPPEGASLAAVYAAAAPLSRRALRHKLMPGATKDEFEQWIMRSMPWQFYARRDQLPPAGNWQIWLMQAGRGAGKTRAGSEWSFEQAVANPGWHVGVLSPTSDDLNRVTFDGPSGLMRLVERFPQLVRKVAKRPWQIEFRNGSRIQSFTGEAYERLRGPQHHAFWADELAGMARVADAAFEQVMFGLRLGKMPRVMLTSTPRVIALFQRLNERHAQGDPVVTMTRASTMDNAANLSQLAIDELRASYDGTRLGEQELYGKLLLDVPGALWRGEFFQQASMPDHLDRIVIGVDPSGAADAKSKSDEIGIVAAGLVRGRNKADDRYYVIEDATLIGSPQQWGMRVVTCFDQWDADRVVAEGNFGGAMVEATVKQADASVPVKMVTASRGKAIRAEPISALYEQGRVFHVGRTFAKLENQMCHMTASGYVGDGSPDHLDAAVWALTELSGGLRAVRAEIGGPGHVSHWLPNV
jgi:phage terminase large subunit-like protein